MKLRGVVTGIRVDGPLTREKRTVTVNLWYAGSIELSLSEHEARAYVVGRSVDVEISPAKQRKGKA